MNRRGLLGLVLVSSALVVLLLGTGTASADVTCCSTVSGDGIELDVSAHTAYTLTHNWAIHKSVDQPSLTLAPGQSATVNYTVQVSYLGSTASNWVVGDGVAAHTLFGTPISDRGGIQSYDVQVNQDSSFAATLFCNQSGLSSLPDFGTDFFCQYEADLPSGDSGSVTGTIHFGDKSSLSTTAPFAFVPGDPSLVPGQPTQVNQTVDVSDSLQGPLGSVTAPNSQTFTYQRTITAPGGSCSDFSIGNTATLTDHATANVLGTSSASVSVHVACPDVSVVKTADQTTVSAGHSIGFTVQVCSNGNTAASNVVLNDPLPAGTAGDLNWTIDTTTGNPSSFQVTGAQGSQTLAFNPSPLATLAQGACLSVHITSPTSSADAATTASGFDSSGTAAAGMVVLGTAKNYAVLGLPNTQINNSLVTITGNEGVSQGGTLTNMAPSSIKGNVYEYASGQYSGPGVITGSVNVNPGLLAQNDADALAASAAAAGLAPTQTFGNINVGTTVTGNGGLNVIQINGSITKSLILNGGPNDVFIVNVTGTVSLGGSDVLGLAGGVAANHVLYNFVGNSGTIATHVGNVLYGTLLAPKYSFNLDGAFIGEIIGGGKSIALLSGAKVYGQASVTNTASVSFGAPDPTPSDNTSSAAITFQ